MSGRQSFWLSVFMFAAMFSPGGYAGTDYVEDFESLTIGPLDGQGGWHGWGGNDTTFANVVNTHNHTGGGSQSAELAAGADSVTENTYTSGRWRITAWTFAPNTFVGKTYFIVLNTYDDLGPFEWAVQIGFNGDTARLECDCGTGTVVQAPLVTGAWAVLQVDVDLDTGTTDVYYDTTTSAIATYQWENGVFGTDNFAMRAIDAIDLYPDAVGFPHVTPIYFDDLSIESVEPPDPGTPVCFGDGSGAPCGCLNESDPGSMSGCLNSVSVGGIGAVLSSCGAADLTAPALRLDVTGVRTQPGLMFQGNNTIGGGSGSTFGDGVRCCGAGVIRLAILDPPPGPEPTTATFTVSSTPPGVTPGDKRCYQYWYRDSGGPCGTNFNLSNAQTVIWLLDSGTSCGSGHQCPMPLPPGCLTTCPTGVTVTHDMTITGNGNGTSYGERFIYTPVPAANYCLEIREVVTTDAGADGCNCNLAPVITMAVTLDCTPVVLTDTITNEVTNNTPCGCQSVSTQRLECRPRGSSGAWTTFHENELKWERLANGDIRVTVTPDGGAPVSHTQPGPDCP